MRSLLSLALGLLALEAALALDLDLASFSSAEAMCPKSSASEEMSCAQEQTCITSEDCFGNLVCCPSACGRSCRTPIYDTQKTRSCPWVQTALAPELCEARNECIKHRDCQADKRCCFDGCALQCVNPDAESPLQ
ncbi:PREDICTED: whey acidic protein-like [Chinchilla lanigera]|uniref:whey acidic protein-like n=1 Tax=Chinchilla lanigera TaxID=34839 RepID=UPI00038EC644|nr:PREDICTED: whey acidic protein-like [Chinchilla lanigera]